jgi:hypothetical protein
MDRTPAPAPTVVFLPAGLLLAVKAVAAGEVLAVMQGAVRDPERGTWVVTVPMGLELAVRATLHDGLQQQLADEPPHRHATYRRFADRAMTSLLAS